MHKFRFQHTSGGDRIQAGELDLIPTRHNVSGRGAKTSLLLLKCSRRDNWDENVRRQYVYRGPHLRHPYGTNEEPKHFRDFHVFSKIRVLHQLTVWTFWNPDKLRSHFAEVKEWEQNDYWVYSLKLLLGTLLISAQNMHPVGWDRHDRTYFKFDDERLYRRTDPPIPEPIKAKAKYTSKKSQSQRRQQRSSKRRKTVESDGDDADMGDADETMGVTQPEDGDTSMLPPAEEEDPEKVDTFGEYKWECVAVSLDEYNDFLASIAKSKDPNEKQLKEYVTRNVLPALQAAEEKRQRKLEARQREMHLQEKMLGAKRSGRLAAKQEREQQEKEEADRERQRQALLSEARKDQEQRERMEDDRKSRMMTREARIREREMKRVLLEEELARDSEEEKKVGDEGRGARHIKQRIEKTKKELDEFADDEWTFDCSGCGQYGKNFDDGEHSIACERCNVWQHSKCLGFTKSAAESDDFHFVCIDCKRKEEEANRPKISLKFKVGPSSSPPQPTQSSPELQRQPSPVLQKLVSVDVPARPSAPGVVVDGQFYPAPDQARAAPVTQSQPQIPPPIGQPAMPAYAMKGLQRSIPYMNGGQPYSSNAYNAYAPQDRLHGSSHAQNLYNQITNPVPQYPPHAGSPSQYPVQPRPSSSQSQTPRPLSSHSQMNGHSSPVRQRMASPVINPPTMSPSQGNRDVGPIAGVPGSSPLLQPASTATPHTNGHHANGSAAQQTPVQQSFSSNSSFSASQHASTQPVSGLSPTKQRISASPLPQPSLVPQKQREFQTPTSSFNNNHPMRSVSGTPIFPPSQNLAPSPQQLNREPVPTPSKQSPPLPQGQFDPQPVMSTSGPIPQAHHERQEPLPKQLEPGSVQ